MICVKKLFSLTDNKFYFDETTILSQNKIIDIENKDYTDKRIALYNKDFNNNEYITIKGFKIDPDVELIIPYYECTSFLCSKCKKLHNGKSNKCCSLSSSPILIKQYKIKKIVFPDKNSIEEELAKAKKDFIDLHFPDFLDRIMI